MKSVAVTFLAGALIAMVMMTNGFSIRPGPRSPVGTCPNKDGEFPVYLPDSSDCQIFYECSAGNATEKECMEGLCFDPQLNVCTFPNTNDSDVSESSYSMSVYAPVGGCPPRDTNDTIFLPDSDDCSIYYLCSNGVAIQNSCPPEMSWNTDSNICDWEVDVGCQNGTGELLDMSVYSPVGSCPPRDTNVTIFLPDSENCTLYYLCSNGKAILNACPPEMSWNTEQNICDWNIDAGCTPGNRRESYEVNNYAPIGDCPPRDSNVTIFLRDDANCSIYYICSNGRPILNVCAPGQTWNSDINTCDWDINVECKLRTPEIAHIAPYSPVGDCPVRDGSAPVFLADSDACNIYYLCSNGVAIQNECPPEMSWNNEADICDWEIDVNCESSGSTSSSSTSPNSTTTSTPAPTTSQLSHK